VLPLAETLKSPHPLFLGEATPIVLLALLYPFGYNRDVYTVRLTDEFQTWLDQLPDRRGQIRIAARLRQAEAGNLGDWAPVGDEVSEMRVHFGPGYRLYFTRRGGVLIVMLAGGDKSSQQRDIRRAQRIAKELGDDV
jgi:putative addiction module killer protein